VIIDVVYCAWNRLEFTRDSFERLISNTDWRACDSLIVYDDGSVDGTAEYLEQRCAELELPVASIQYRQTRTGSPGALMNHYLESSTADAFAKVDNDIAMPPGWLTAAASVLERDNLIQLLGLATGWTGTRREACDRSRWEPSSHIGGVGLMRTGCFRKHGPIPADGRQGFTQWQQKHEPIRGWIVPDVAAVQLDLVPADPWRALSEFYLEKAWQRRWPPYEDRSLWEWIL
jgi:glycosyltransferase involved in cell wall biosynthesis